MLAYKITSVFAIRKVFYKGSTLLLELTGPLSSPRAHTQQEVSPFYVASPECPVTVSCQYSGQS